MTQSKRRAELLAQLNARLASLRDLEDGTLYFEQSGPQYVAVTKEGDNVLLWLMDIRNPVSGVVQSELSLTEPLRLVDPYTQAALLGLLWNDHPQRIFTTGLGGGCLPTYLHCLLPDTTIDCVEIDARVVDAAATGFGFQTDATLRIAVDDGRAWLESRRTEKPYDLVIVDAFLDNGYAPFKMATREFSQLAATRLTPTGVFVLNLLYLGEYYTERIKTVASVFAHVYLLRMGEDNDLLFASNASLSDKAILLDKARDLENRLSLRFSLFSRVEEILPVESADIPGWQTAEILCDADPPEGYFTTLPAFDGVTSTQSAHAPCLCGSGLAFGRCHGREAG